MSHDIEILPPAITSKSEARSLIQKAVTHFRTAKRASIQVMADLRKLQDAQVHLLYGEKNFAVWVERTFDGLSVGNVRQLCRAGAVVLELESRGLIDLSNPEGVGATGLRELSVVSKTYGTQKMIEIFKISKEIAGGKDVSGTIVESALKLLMPPASEEDGISDIPEQDSEPEEDTDEEKNSEKVQELIDRIRDLAYDLPDESSTGELQDCLLQLKKELAKEDDSKDQDWIDSAR